MVVADDALTLLYRPMGDAEAGHLLAHGALPSTQPYQAVMEGAAGRSYAEKYLSGKKWVDTAPTTVVEFCLRKSVVAALMARQHKCEDGCLSMGLGPKAGNGLALFNAAIVAAADAAPALPDFDDSGAQDKFDVPLVAMIDPPPARVGYRIVTVKRPLPDVARKAKKR